MSFPPLFPVFANEGALPDPKTVVRSWPSIGTRAIVALADGGIAITDGLSWTVLRMPLRSAFSPADYDGNLGNYRTKSQGSGITFRYSFIVPQDFRQLVSVALIGTPGANIIAGNFDLFSSYGADGQSITQFTEADIASTYNMTAGIWNKLSLATVFNSLAAGHRCGVEVSQIAIGTTVNYLGILLEYM